MDGIGYDQMKTVCAILLLAVCAGFILYKLYWRRKNLQTDGRIDTDPDFWIQGNPNGTDKRNAEDAFASPEGGGGEYDRYVEKIQSEISSRNDLEILESYRNTSDLRTMLLNKSINATQVIHHKHLIPKGMVIRKNGTKIPSLAIPGKASPTAGLPMTSLPDSSKGITDYPDWFGNSRTNRRDVPTTDDWKGGGRAHDR